MLSINPSAVVALLSNPRETVGAAVVVRGVELEDGLEDGLEDELVDGSGSQV